MIPEMLKIAAEREQASQVQNYNITMENLNLKDRIASLEAELAGANKLLDECEQALTISETYVYYNGVEDGENAYAPDTLESIQCSLLSLRQWKERNK